MRPSIRFTIGSVQKTTRGCLPLVKPLESDYTRDTRTNLHLSTITPLDKQEGPDTRPQNSRKIPPVTPLTAAQWVYALTQVHPGNGQTLKSALPGLCRLWRSWSKFAFIKCKFSLSKFIEYEYKYLFCQSKCNALV